MTNTLTRRLILIACFVIASTSTYAQNVTAKDDEFSGKRTVTMSAQRLTPTLTLTLKRVVDTTRRTSFYETDLAFAEAVFRSTTGKREYGAPHDGYELNFLVDGERVQGGRTGSDVRDDMSETGYESIYGMIPIQSLEKIARGRKVQMKLHETVVTLDAQTIVAIKEFIAAMKR